MRFVWTCLLLLMLGFGLRSALAQTTPAASAPAIATDIQVTLSSAIEDGKKQLIATVKRNGKPVENATVSFGAKRMFGRLVLGTDVTLDDGTAAIPFPSDLPGDAKGDLELNAMIQGPLSQWGATTEAVLPGGKPRAAQAENFPRALWAPSAPLSLIAAIAALVGGAWGSYLFVFYQLIAIRRGATT